MHMNKQFFGDNAPWSNSEEHWLQYKKKEIVIEYSRKTKQDCELVMVFSRSISRRLPKF